MRTAIAVLGLATVMFAGTAFGQQQIDWDKVQIKTTDLGNKTYMLAGLGGNITIAVGSDAIIMVDGQFAPLHDKIKAAITAISPLPIKYLINTHFHADHTGGNGPFQADGAIVVAQDNIRIRLTAGTTNGASGIKTPPVATDALPKETYVGGTRIVEAGGRVAKLTHVNNAHTDGDTWIYFADANVLITGDLFNNFKQYSSIDFANGGDIRGMVAANETFLRLSNDQTKIVPGHGGLATKADVVEFHKMLVTARDRIQKLVEEGKSEDEVVAMMPLSDLDAIWANKDHPAKEFTRMVYNSFKRS